jgi:thiol-disulfide isomerase/thioredoxin
MKEAAPWVVVGVVAVAVLFLMAPRSESLPVLAPEFALETLSGETVTLSALRGKLIILDFWASWCKPCTRTLPGLDELATRLADRDVVLLAISLDRTEKAAREYAVAHDFPASSVLYGSLDEVRVVKDLYGVVGIPRTFLIDREGFVRYSGGPSGVTEELVAPWL